MTITTSELLRAAAEHIRKYGHAKDNQGYVRQPTCLIGSVGAAVEILDPGNIRGAWGLMEATWDVIDNRLADQTVAWNKTATAEEAIALLEELAFDEELTAFATGETMVQGATIER